MTTGFIRISQSWLEYFDGGSGIIYAKTSELMFAHWLQESSSDDGLASPFEIAIPDNGTLSFYREFEDHPYKSIELNGKNEEEFLLDDAA